MRSQLNASVSPSLLLPPPPPPSSLRRALPSATPRALRYATRTTAHRTSPASASIYAVSFWTEPEHRALPDSRLHAFPWRFRATPRHHGRGAGARRATNLPAPGSQGTVKRLLCRGLVLSVYLVRSLLFISFVLYINHQELECSPPRGGQMMGTLLL